MATDEVESHVIIDIEDSFTSTLDKPTHPSFRGLIYEKDNVEMPLICKVESTGMNDEGKKDYEPNVLSIGPYHNGKPGTEAVQIIKYECLDYFLLMNQDKKLKDYIKAIMEMENQIMSFYHNKIEMERNSFIKMLLLDGCFILRILEREERGISPSMLDMPYKDIKLKMYENNGETVIDMNALDVHGSPQIIQTAQEAINEDDHIRMLDYGLFSSDILLVENQIPFFVIAKIYEIAKGENRKTSCLTESISKYVERIIEFYPKSLTACQPKEFYHMLHLCHMYLKPNKVTLQSYETLDLGPCHWHRATEYSKTGINFNKKEFFCADPHSLLDIEFCDGTMEIPCFTIVESTRCLFPNLIAFEKKCPQIGNQVTAFVAFWSQFISMPDDVALLTKKGIIVNLLNNNDEVCDIFRKLTNDVFFDFHGVGNYLNSTYLGMEAYYRKNKPKLVTRLGSIASNLHRFIF